MNGKISQWKDDKGFGFIQPDDGSEKVFFHISSVKTNARRPQVGDAVVYEATRDSQQRLKAKGVVIENVAIVTLRKNERNHVQTEGPENNLFDYVSILTIFAGLIAFGVEFYRYGSVNDSLPFAIPMIAALVILKRQKKPKETTFKCSKCGIAASHDSRTIEAWNNGFTKLYCRTCHIQWLKDNPRHIPTKGSGCLGALALVFIVPVSSILGIYEWFF